MKSFEGQGGYGLGPWSLRVALPPLSTVFSLLSIAAQLNLDVPVNAALAERFGVYSFPIGKYFFRVRVRMQTMEPFDGSHILSCISRPRQASRCPDNLPPARFISMSVLKYHLGQSSIPRVATVAAGWNNPPCKRFIGAFTGGSHAHEIVSEMLTIRNNLLNADKDERDGKEEL
eukprot:6180243-Pleurochrysis_carterae.AAC.3